MKKIIVLAAAVLGISTMCGCSLLRPIAKEVGGYSMWNENGLRLFMDDNGTPGNYEDDWVVDWEDNRSVSVMVFD